MMAGSINSIPNLMDARIKIASLLSCGLHGCVAVVAWMGAAVGGGPVDESRYIFTLVAEGEIAADDAAEISAQEEQAKARPAISDDEWARLPVLESRPISPREFEQFAGADLTPSDDGFVPAATVENGSEDDGWTVPVTKAPTETGPEEPLEVREIDVREMLSSLDFLRESSDYQAYANDDVNPSEKAITSYITALYARLKLVWQRPRHFPHMSLVTTMRFQITPGGRIHDVEVLESSGNPVFDQSVVTAFQRVGTLGATPTGEPYAMILNVEMRK